ncbi:MAG: hypothetical protein WBM50_08975 [Acidimicrobiales bacterium]
MMILEQRHVDICIPDSRRPRPGWQGSVGSSDRCFTEVRGVSPLSAAVTGDNRLQVNADITGVHAHAAVCMHASPVTGFTWAYGPKTKTNHFQRSKVAT